MRRVWSRDGGAQQREDGVVALIVALTLTSLVVVTALMIDFGLARLDRQSNKLASDSAVTAGMQALEGEDEQFFAFKGVCEAIEYLQASRPDLTGLSWGLCDGSRDSLVCIPGNTATYARFEQDITATDGSTYHVEVRSPYNLREDVGDFAEENTASLAGDREDAAVDACNQIGVQITQSREPGFGSLATDEDITSSIRSVGRIEAGDAQSPVALLLLERNDCGVLEISGANAKIRVMGTPEGRDVDGVTVIPSSPAVIHADSLGNGDDCGSGSNVYNGNKDHGIVAEESFEAPPRPGIITTPALTAAGVPAKATDPFPFVITKPGPPNEPTPRDLVTRALPDEAYLDLVRSEVYSAEATVFGAITPANAVANGYKVLNDCRPTQAMVNALNLTSASKLYVDCTSPAGFRPTNVTIQAGTIFFNGFIASSATNLDLPNANRVYVYGATGPGAIGLNASGTFKMHNFGAASCGTGTSANGARLFVKNGQLAATGGLLQLCHTTVILMGGQGDACLPSTSPVPPTATPCGGSWSGSGFVSLSGGASVDWTAPNTTTNKVTVRTGLEDLALWTESYGDGPTYSMTGSGAMTLRGVFMAPNADPFNIKGGGGQDVKDSQYVATKLNVTGNGELLMQPAAGLLTLPPPPNYFLVR